MAAMILLRSILQELILETIEQSQALLPATSLRLQRPRQSEHGELFCTLPATVLPELFLILRDRCLSTPWLSRMTTAAPCFLNLTLSEQALGYILEQYRTAKLVDIEDLNNVGNCSLNKMARLLEQYFPREQWRAPAELSRSPASSELGHKLARAYTRCRELIKMGREQLEYGSRLFQTCTNSADSTNCKNPTGLFSAKDRALTCFIEDTPWLLRLAWQRRSLKAIVSGAETMADYFHTYYRQEKLLQGHGAQLQARLELAMVLSRVLHELHYLLFAAPLRLTNDRYFG